MIRPWTMLRISQGPHLAQKELRQYGLDRLFVISDQGRKLLGAVTNQSIQQAIQRGDRTLENSIEPDLVYPVSPDCSIDNLIELTVKDMTPLSVVDGECRFLGIIVRSTVLAAINAARETAAS